MTDGLLGWRGGTLGPVDDAAWAPVVASFLGAGFRIDLPGGDRTEAVRHERARVDRLAGLLGAELPESAWTALVASHEGHALEIVGGWPRSSLGPGPFQAACRAVEESLEEATAAVLSTPLAPRLTDGLPTISRLSDDVAARAIEADIGIWLDSAGTVVASTAGPVLARRADGSWAMGVGSESWLACVVAREHGAQGDLRAADLGSATYLGVVRRALGVQTIRILGMSPAS